MASQESPAPSDTPEDETKRKFREALERKKGNQHPDDSAEAKSKTHGPEVVGGAPKMHRRKAGGGGS